MTEKETIREKEQIAIEKVMLEYKLLINKRLYEQKQISFEIYEKMTEKLLNRLNKQNVNQKTTHNCLT